MPVFSVNIPFSPGTRATSAPLFPNLLFPNMLLPNLLLPKQSLPKLLCPNLISSVVSAALWLLAVFWLTLSTTTHAQDNTSQTQTADQLSGTTLRVGTKVAAPFSMLDDNGQWHGISIDLMRLIAEELNVELQFVEQQLSELISNVASGDLDTSIAAISITPEREKIIDFSHQYFGSGLAIVTPEQYQAGWKSMLKALISPQFLATVFLLCCVLAFVGVIIWILESSRNTDQFGKSPGKGIGSGFWFAAVTMTTVGYGDKAPITLAGRVVSVIWMFAALILTAFLTAQLTTILTAQQTQQVVTGVGDLPKAKVGNLEGASSLRYFEENGIKVSGFETIAAGFDAVASGKIDAFVHDQPLLRYRVNQSNQPLLILPDMFDPQSYAIVVAQDSPLREAINVALLKILTSSDWLDVQRRYFGS